jgi:hypothetical protein
MLNMPQRHALSKLADSQPEGINSGTLAALERRGLVDLQAGVALTEQGRAMARVGAVEARFDAALGQGRR